MTAEILYTYLSVFVAIYITSVPWGYFIGRINGVDIRKHGSGNIGATNVTRVIGKQWGVLCFVLDLLKGFLPVIIVKILMAENLIITDAADLSTAIAAFAAFAGHVWTPYLGFKGGKGIATTAGILLALAPWALLTAAALWFVVFQAFRYVSLASIAAALLLPVTAYIFSIMEFNSLQKPELTLLILLSALAIWKHRSNIKKLINGTENRFEKKDKNSDKREGQT